MATDFDGSQLGWAARMGDALVGVQTTIDGWRFSPRMVAAWVLAVAAFGCGLWLLFSGTSATPVESVLPRATSAVVESAVDDATPGVASAGSPEVLVVHVVGAVVAPGVVEVPAGSRIRDAVDAAGGMTLVADPSRMNLAAKVADGQRIAVPAVGETPPAVVDGSGDGGGAPDSGPTPASPLDVNLATAEQLDQLPGVGPATASAIVAYREQHGAFRSVDALADVRGIGPAKLDQIRPLVVV